MTFYDLLAWLDNPGCSRYLSYLPRLCENTGYVVGGVELCIPPENLRVGEASFTYIPREVVSSPRDARIGALPALTPLTLREARILARAKLRIPATILVRFSNLKFFDEGEVSVLAQNRQRPLLEVCLGEIVSEGLRRGRLGTALRRVSLLLEKALKEGVEVAISSCTHRDSHPLFCGQRNGVLAVMGFTHSERVQMLYANPADLVRRWRSIE